MNPLFLFFTGGVCKDILAGTIWYRYRQNEQADQTMRRWEHRRKIPMLNWFLKRQAGKPANRMERKRNSLIVNTVRGLVNTETVEHIVAAFLNSRSKLKVRTTSKPSVMRWGKLDIIT
jgi:hypothetical protein